VDEVFTVGANRAISLLAEKQERGDRGRASPAALNALGEHPTLGGAVVVRAGRYGPYVNHGKVNATLPKSVKPEELTLDQAVTLLAEKAEKSGIGQKAPAKRAVRKTAAKRNTAAAGAKPAGGKSGSKRAGAKVATAKPAAAKRAAPKRTAAE
jgi:DNA topoisomerase-1